MRRKMGKSWFTCYLILMLIMTPWRARFIFHKILSWFLFFLKSFLWFISSTQWTQTFNFLLYLYYQFFFLPLTNHPIFQFFSIEQHSAISLENKRGITQNGTFSPSLSIKHRGSSIKSWHVASTRTPPPIYN